MDIKELKDKVKAEPIKKAVEFDDLYDVVIEFAGKGQVGTLKMLKQVYDAYKEQNSTIAEGFSDILKRSLIRENGDIPTSIYIPGSATKVIEDCYHQMIANKSASQQIMDRYTGPKKKIEEYDEKETEASFRRV